MKFTQLLTILFIATTPLLVGCGNSSSNDSFENEQVLSFNDIQAINSANGGSNSQGYSNADFIAQLGATPIPTPRPATPDGSGGTPGGNGSNDFTSRTLNFIDGADGNLWKPVSENNGNIVVLFNSSFRRTFSGGCSIQKNDGTFSPLYCGGVFNCFTNPNRLTMRSNVPCEDALEVKVTCNDANQVVVFTVPAALRSQTCDRHD